MSSDALSIVTEYAKSRDAKARRNAATALAALNTRESLEQLAVLTLEDPDNEVRQRGEEELSRLEGQFQTTAIESLLKRLADRRWTRKAYALLGRLRNSGAAVPSKGPGSFYSRLRSAVSASSLLDPTASWRPRLRPLLSGLVGSLIGGVLIGIVFIVSENLNDPFELILVLLAGIGLSALLTLFVSQRTNSFNLHFDRAAGAIGELASVAIGATVFSLLALILVFGGAPVSFVPIVALVLVTSMMAVRLGTLLAPGQFKSAFVGRSIAVLVGAGSGILMFSISTGVALWLYAVLDMEDLRDAQEVLRFGWLAFLPSAFGAAHVFSREDAKAPYKGAIKTVARRHLAVGALAFYALAGVSWTFGAAEQRIEPLIRGARMIPVPEAQQLDESDFQMDLASGTRKAEVRLASVPAIVTLNLENPVPVKASLPPGPLDFVLLFYSIPELEGDQAQVELRRLQSGQGYYAFQDDPPVLEQLKPGLGTYAIVADEYSQWSDAAYGDENDTFGLNPDDIYGRTMSRLTWFAATVLSRPTDPEPEQQTIESTDEYQLVVEIGSELDRLRQTARVIQDALRANGIYVEELRAANDSPLSLDQILERDERWVSGEIELINEVLNRLCSRALGDLQSQIPGLVEIFLTDMQGVNVCQSSPTSDFYQADEGWWQITLARQDVYIGAIDYDESAGLDSQSVHLPIVDPVTMQVIGIARAILDAEPILSRQSSR